MTFINNNKQQYDLPLWQPLAPLPIASGAGSATCTADDGTNKLLYYTMNGLFYCWSSVTNGWLQLASLPTAAVTSIALKYSKFAGYRGNCLGATSNSMTVAPVSPSLLVGKTVRIMSGAGAGQDRIIRSATTVKIWDKGLLTAITAQSLTDNLKNWKINQFVGYQVKLTYGTGQTIIRKVLYNDATTLYFQDANYQQLEAWQNTAIYTASPYTLPVTTAGSQAHYQIETADITVDTWTVIPDSTSSFAVLTGGIFALTGNASAPWSTMYYYDCLLDCWTQKTAIGGHLLAGLTGDWSLERTGEVGGIFIVNSATTSATTTSITTTSLALVVDSYVNYQIRITGGTGMGQRRRILSNTSNTFNIDKPWNVNPDATSTYSIYGNTNVMYLSGNNQASLYQYNVEEDIWSPSTVYTIGEARNGSVTFGGQEGIAITSIARNTGGVTAVTTVPVAGGSAYTVGDILTLSTAGTLGKVKVTSVNITGAVTGVILYGCGLTYATGTSATTGGTGTACTIAITSVGVVGRVTTAHNHNLAIGDSYVSSGAVESLWNVSSTVLGCDSLTMFDIATTATAVWAAAQSQGTTLLVDSVQNWTVNEHTGRLVTIQVAGTSPTTQVRRIVSNTATTLTLNAAITTAVNGTSRYVISEPYLQGRAVQYPAIGMGGVGYATSGTTTTLVDSTKAWIPNQWAGAKFRIMSGIGIGNEVAITSNTETTLTYSVQSFTPTTATKYLIMDSFGLATAGSTTTLTDSTKKWAVNQWAGKKLRIISGTGQGQELIIVSNTVNVLTFALATAPDTTSNYCILESQQRGVGSNINWVFGNTDPATKGDYIVCFFGNGTNVFGRYNITTELWEITQITSPQGELLTTGSSFAYSGKDRLYYQVNSTGRVGYVELNSLSNNIMCQLTWAPLGTAIVGNRLEVITTDDGVDFLVLLDNTGSRIWRSQVLY